MQPGGSLVVPDEPIIPFIEGDGIGVDIWPAAKLVLDAAAAKYGKRVEWKEVLAGEKAFNETGNWLPDETVEAFREHLIGIKGPLTTPIGGGIRSLNVALRQLLDLYVCLRPVRWFTGVPSPVRHPETGRHGHLQGEHRGRLRRHGGAGGHSGSHRARGVPVGEVRLGAARPNRDRDQADLRGGLEAAHPRRDPLRARPRSQERHDGPQGEHPEIHRGAPSGPGATSSSGTSSPTWRSPGTTCGGKPGDKLLVKDAIADITLQQVLTRPDEFDVIATMNLNGDYLSDALAAQVGGIGIAPGGNINYVTGHGIFEATHGTAPKYAGQDKVNPGSLLLSGVLMYEHLGWTEAAADILRALEATIADKIVTYDFARLMEGATEVKCSEFAAAVAERL